MNPIRAFLVGSALLLFPACATLSHGPTQNILVDSVPRGATVTVNDQVRGQTPTTINFVRIFRYRLQMDLVGYKTEYITLCSRPYPEPKMFLEQPWSILAALFPTNAAYLAIDYLTTSAWYLSYADSKNVVCESNYENWDPGIQKITILLKQQPKR